jgi:pimeloyl-ACP methyl ester carboxylesterase
MNEVFGSIEAVPDRLLESLVDAPASKFRQGLQELANASEEMSGTSALILRGAITHLESISEDHHLRTRKAIEGLTNVLKELSARRDTNALLEDWRAYLNDSGQRFILTLDALRERGDIFLTHEAAGCPPVLTYDYEVIVDGANLPRPCNYMLLRILPPEGIELKDSHRPYIIIDPRAGHGAGIGGFKTDSQVGVALSKGHQVYFVSFKRDPVPGQTLADVTRAEAEFIREVARRHPKAPKPVVTGNCQGGWATLLLAATNPDLTGPIVLNGAPVATWSGEVGKNPMRYNGGILGGTWEAMFWADVGGGVFDGAHLVMNFEMLNPSRSFFAKYYYLYAKVDTERDRFLEFETWWGGFFLLNEAEIHWIVEQLFVGNRLAKNEARLEPGRNIDVKQIRSPIIVFTSHGDNITPPQQALNWIVDSYADVSEIKIRGQRIIYMVHDQVGHLGIFVSSKIAKREHTEVASTMETIEALAPGLYEMKIEDYQGEGVRRAFTVSFHERTLHDLRALDDDREDEASFAAVARASEIQAQLYDVFLRPLVRASVNAASAELGRAAHPLRLQRALMSDRNPLLGPLASMAEKARADRHPASPENPFVRLEHVFADLIEQSLDLYRDMRDAWYEIAFFSMWGTPWALAFGQAYRPGRTLKNEAELRALPEVHSALHHMSEGGFVEAVIRMLILLAESRGNVRRDRLERSEFVLTQDEPFRSLSMDQRKQIIDEQSLIVQFEPERAIETLPDLLTTPEERRLAVEVVQFVPGTIDEMAPSTLDMLQRFHRVLELPPVTDDVLKDPLANRVRPTIRSEVAAE